VGNEIAAITAIRAELKSQSRSYSWLAREACIPYKRLLSEVKHAERRLSLETAVGAANVLNMDLATVLNDAAAA
jgi:hypothetical protein